MTCSEGEHNIIYDGDSECGCVWVQCTECSFGEKHEECDNCFDDQGEYE
jgi:hypothetical protein